MPPKKELIAIVKKYKPLADRIIVLPEEKEKMTGSGIYLADSKSGESRRQCGTVLAVGKGRISEQGAEMPVEVKVGQRILFKAYAGDEILVTPNGIEKYVGEAPREDELLILFVRNESILAILPN